MTATEQQPSADRWLKRQQAIVTIGRRSSRPSEPAVLIQDAAALVAEMLDTKFSVAAELSFDGRSLNVRLSRTNSEGGEALIHRCPLDPAESLLAYALRMSQPVFVADLRQQHPVQDRFFRGQGIRSVIAVPLRLQDKTFGILAACTDAERAFDEADTMFVETVAHLVSTTLGCKRAEDEALSAKQDAEEARRALAGAQGKAAFSPEPVPSGEERRKRVRRAYPYSQMLAPIIDGKFPDRNEFQLVHCNDIAAAGFSYTTDAPPLYEMVVVALGLPPAVTYVTAQVIHITHQQEGGGWVYRVGCKFTGRATY
jgi:hypothetical protein